MRASNFGGVSMQGQIPMAERTSLFHPGSGKRRQNGKGSDRSDPIHRGPSVVDSILLCDGGTLDLDGAAVSLGSLTLDGGTLTLDSRAWLGGEMAMLGGGMLTVDDHASVPGPTEASLIGGVVHASRVTRCDDPRPEEPQAVEGRETRTSKYHERRTSGHKVQKRHAASLFQEKRHER